MYHNIKSTLQRARNTSIAIGAVITAGLMLSSPALHAKQKSDLDEGWSEWQAMGNAYVARRRQPPKLSGPKAERRQANVQARLEKLRKNKRKLLAQLKNANAQQNTHSIQAQKQGKTNKNHEALNPAKAQKQLKNLNKQIAIVKASNNNRSAKGNKGSKTPALWLHTGEEGLYAITLTELAAKTGASEKKLRKKAKKGKLNLTTGEQIDSETANQAVSWHFDEDSDSLLFAAQARVTFHSDENAYKFKLDRKNAAPMAVNNNAVTSNFGSETPFHDTLKFEEEPDSKYVTWAVASEPDADFWFWHILFAGYDEYDHHDFNLSVPDPASSGTARLRVTLRGTTDLYDGDEHHVFAVMNGTTTLGDVTWDGFEKKVLDVEFDQSILNSGDNTLTLYNVYAAGPHAVQRLDQVELDYLRNPIALNGKLWMHEPAVGTQTVTGFDSDDILVIESPDGTAVLRQDALIERNGTEGWKVVFDANGDADYLITARTAFNSLAGMTIDHNAKLRNPYNNAEYLIIAPRVFEESAEALALHRGSRYSSVKIAWLEDIYNEFSAGREDPAAIARFMKRVVNKWNIAPANVVLWGKGTIDQLDRMGYGDNFIPVAMTSTPWALAASDGRLLGFEEDAPFAFGRIPITNNTEGLAYINKLWSYETTTPGLEKFSAVLAADNPDAAGDFHTNTDRLSTRLLDTLGFDTVTTLYHPASDVSASDVRAGLIDSNTWNTGYVSYDGHGSTSQIGDYRENFISAFPDADNDYGDAGRLSNSVYPIFTVLTCAAGNDLSPGVRSLASALVLNPSGGAIASIAPTGLSLDHDAQALGNAIVDNLFAVNSTIGDALNDAKYQTRGRISPFMAHIYTVIGEPGIYAR